MKTYDVAVVGGGIVGLATAWRLLEKDPRLSIVLLEKEGEAGAHQTGHNSGVIHSGLYYKPGSEKAKTCVEGGRLLVEFCRTHGVPHEICGKLVVATSEDELPRLADLARPRERERRPGASRDGAGRVPEGRAARGGRTRSPRPLDGNHGLRTRRADAGRPPRGEGRRRPIPREGDGVHLVRRPRCAWSRAGRKSSRGTPRPAPASTQTASPASTAWTRA